MTGATERYLSIDEAAERYHCSLSTIRRWRAQGRLPEPYKMGRRVLWKVSDLDAWDEETRRSGGSRKKDEEGE